MTNSNGCTAEVEWNEDELTKGFMEYQENLGREGNKTPSSGPLPIAPTVREAKDDWDLSSGTVVDPAEWDLIFNPPSPEDQAQDDPIPDIDRNLWTAIQTYIEKGMPVVLTDGEKTPVHRWKEYQSRSMTVEEAQEHVRKARKQVQGFAVVNGKHSNGNIHVTVDIDDPDLVEPLKQKLEKAEVDFSVFPQMASHRGIQFAFYADTLDVAGNMVAHRRTQTGEYAPAIEVFCTSGHLSQRPPSAHPKGGHYREIEGTMDEPPVLAKEQAMTIIRVIKDMDEKPDPEVVQQQAKAYHETTVRKGQYECDGLAVIKECKRRNRIEDVLGELGYKSRRNGYYSHPKEKQGYSVHVVGDDCSCHFGANDPYRDVGTGWPKDNCTIHDAFSLICASRYHGDTRTAIRDLARQYGMDGRVDAPDLKEPETIQVTEPEASESPSQAPDGQSKYILELEEMDLPPLIVTIAQEIQRTVKLKTLTGPLFAALFAINVAHGKGCIFEQSGKRYYTQLSQVYLDVSGTGKTPFHDYLLDKLREDGGLSLGTIKGISYPQFMANFGEKVGKIDGKPLTDQEPDIIQKHTKWNPINLLSDEFMDFFEDMGNIQGPGKDYIPELCAVFDDTRLLKHETIRNGNLWLGDPFINIFGLTVPDDWYRVVNKEKVQAKGLAYRLLPVNNQVLEVRLKSTPPFNHDPYKVLANIRAYIQDKRLVVRFDDTHCEQTLEEIWREPYIAGFIDTFSTKWGSLKSKIFTQSRKVASILTAVDHYTGISSIVDGSITSHLFTPDEEKHQKVIEMDGRDRFKIAALLVTYAHVTNFSYEGTLNVEKEVQEAIKRHLKKHKGKGKDRQKARTLAVMTANIRKLRELGYASVQRLKPIVDVLVQSGMIRKQETEDRRMTYFDLVEDD